jgi:NDP-sugar pyrophosphorylase family protein
MGRGPAIIGDGCEIGPNAYIAPYTSIGAHVTIRDSEIENTIIMEGAYIDCGKRITDSLIGRKVTILSSRTEHTKRPQVHPWRYVKNHSINLYKFYTGGVFGGWILGGISCGAVWRPG